MIKCIPKKQAWLSKFPLIKLFLISFAYCNVQVFGINNKRGKEKLIKQRKNQFHQI